MIGKEVTFETPAGRARIDIVTRTARGALTCIESKNGPGARLSLNQRAIFPVIENKGAIPRGRNAIKANLAADNETGPMHVRIDRHEQDVWR